jgi:hypothetical protein
MKYQWIDDKIKGFQILKASPLAAELVRTKNCDDAPRSSMAFCYAA